MSKIGIIILNYNNSDITVLTIKSLLFAKNKIQYKLFLIDNGSRKEDYDQLKYFIDRLDANQKEKIILIRNDSNLGFSGGNNVALRMILKSKDFSHVCLLNSDVILTDYWADELVKADVDVIGPVSNAVGNEQTVIIDYKIEPQEDCFLIVNEFARTWKERWKGAISKTDFLGFFCVLMKINVIDKIGLLDERFFPGSFEDDDYCLRILKSNFSMYIKRDVYIHHWGSKSFSKLDMKHRINISDVNKKRFEDKWNCEWSDRTYLLVKSASDSIVYLINTNNINDYYGEMLLAYNNSFQKIIKDLVEHNKILQDIVEKNKDYELPFALIKKQMLAKIKRRLGLK